MPRTLLSILIMSIENDFVPQRWKSCFAALSLVLCLTTPSSAAEVGRKDLNTPWVFPKIESKREWQERAQAIRTQALVSCGLWPMPEKTALRAQIFGKILRDGYSVEKVYFQSYPGFYVAGNLYRPVGKGIGPFPGIINPHGHWENGRLTDTTNGSTAARCINFAKQGMVAFTYDMVGYNDTFFAENPKGSLDKVNLYKRHRRFATNEANLLWNINLMGLQTWNSIRALDFLAALPDVDKSRLACTGESGGGTQTFMLGAIDDRLVVQAPIVMVSHSMQGGCSCENAPGLRVEYSNMEIAAAAAPRPQIMVGATGDWTKTMMTVEGPGVESVYRLLNAQDNLRYKIFDFGHNYNQTSREAVYDFFGKILKPVSPASKESPYKKESDEELHLWPNGELPADAVTAEGLVSAMIQSNRVQLESIKPTNKKSFAKFKEFLTPAWKHSMQLGRSETPSLEFLFSPAKPKARGVVILADSSGTETFVSANRQPRGLAKSLFDQGFKVLVLKLPDISEAKTNQADLFFTTYNRTFAQERVADLVNACSWAKKSDGKVVLCGIGQAGLWALLAAPAADAVVADCEGVDVSSDVRLLKTDVFVPGLRKIGAFEGVASLAAPHPLFVNNTGGKFSTIWLSDVYGSMKSAQAIKIQSDRAAAEQIFEWIAKLK